MSAPTPEWMNDDDAKQTLAESHPEWRPRLSQPVISAPVDTPVTVSNERERNNALAGLKREADDLASVGRGQRNSELNRVAWKMRRKYMEFGHLSQREIYDALMQASTVNGHVKDDGRMAHNTCMGALTVASTGAAVAPTIDWHEAPAPNVQIVTQIDGISFDENDCPTFAPPVNGTNGHDVTNGHLPGRFVTLKPLTSVVDDLPDWVWHYGGKGRIQNGTVVILAGRPAAGKSTAARWFTSQLTNGTLPGIWEGHPVNIAYLAAEEQIDVLVKPALRAAEADMSRIWMIGVEDEGREVTMKSITDEVALTTALIEANVRVVVVDPIMATIPGGADIYKNNDVRAHLEPYQRIARAINGVVIGVAHLNKQAAKDVVAGINGSSAFGEIPRAVFGFAKDDSSDEGDRIMSQSKNSAGAEDLALIYRIETTSVKTEARGRTGEVAYFRIIGDSTTTVEEVMTEAGTHTRSADCRMWLGDYLEINGETPYSEVKRAAAKEDFSESTLQRASRTLKVVKRAGSSTPDKPRTTNWSLPPSPPEAVAPMGWCDEDHREEE